MQVQNYSWTTECLTITTKFNKHLENSNKNNVNNKVNKTNGDEDDNNDDYISNDLPKIQDAIFIGNVIISKLGHTFYCSSGIITRAGCCDSEHKKSW